MDTAIWIVTGLLASLNLGAGMSKWLVPYPRLAAQQNWARGFAPATVRLIGAAEVAAAAGLVLPGLLGSFAAIVPVTAICIIVLHLGAAATHLSLGERGMLLVNGSIIALALFVAWGRFAWLVAGA